MRFSEYLDNIEVVDKGIRQLVEVFNQFYDNDGKTAYIFTADHGMTDEGIVTSKCYITVECSVEYSIPA